MSALPSVDARLVLLGRKYLRDTMEIIRAGYSDTQASLYLSDRQLKDRRPAPAKMVNELGKHASLKCQ